MIDTHRYTGDFAFLAKVHKGLQAKANEAVAMVPVSPDASLTAAGMVAEGLSVWAGRRAGIVQGRSQQFGEYLKELDQAKVFPKDIKRHLDELRRLQNAAKHNFEGQRTQQDALRGLELLAQVTRWAEALDTKERLVADPRVSQPIPAPPPAPPRSPSAELQFAKRAEPKPMSARPEPARRPEPAAVLPLPGSEEPERSGIPSIAVFAFVLMGIGGVFWLVSLMGGSGDLVSTPMPPSAPEAELSGPAPTLLPAPLVFRPSHSARLSAAPDEVSQSSVSLQDAATASGWTVGADGKTYLAVSAPQDGYVRLELVSYSTSFDCATAKGFVEIATCLNGEIADLDAHLTGLYLTRLDGADPATDGVLRSAQRDWLQARNACATEDCLARVYEERIAALEVADSPSSVISSDAGPQLADPSGDRAIPAATRFSPTATVQQALGAAANAPRMVSVPDPTSSARYYPDVAVKGAVPGEALIECSVRADGAVGRCQVKGEDPKGYGFGLAALALAKTLVFEPATRRGRPVAGKVLLSIAFKFTSNEY